MPRLNPQPGEIIDRTKRISFRFEELTLPAFAGDTIASALASFGMNIFTRSFKYHRPRGLLCVSGKCPNCLMNVNGTPNVRVCTAVVREGDRVMPQRAWPSLERDALSLLKHVSFLLPVGFYYKTLIRPKLLWKRAEPILRRLAGLGDLDPAREITTHYEHEHVHIDLAIVGGGPAGLAAARAAAEAGAEVVLVDDQPELGGHLRHHRRNFPDPTSGQSKPGFQIARELADAVQTHPRIRVLKSAVASGSYENGLLTVAMERRLVLLRASQVVLATGSYECLSLFENNDLPGIMLGSGALRLMHLYGVRPGRRAVVVTADAEGVDLALDLARAGIHVVAVVDRRPQVEISESEAELKRLRIPHLLAYIPVTANGTRRVRSLTIAPTTSSAPGSHALVNCPCDLVCLAAQRVPSVELLRQNGGTVRFDPVLNRIVLDVIPPDWHLAGEVTGYRDLAFILLQGRVAGLEAAHRLKPLAGERGEELDQLKAQLHHEEEKQRLAIPPSQQFTGVMGSKPFVCLCEDVTKKDLQHAIGEGFDEMELLKRYTTASMGPCQGRMCLMPMAACCAEEEGQTLAEVGITTSRPPVQPVPLGVLAGPHHHPVRLTPMHHLHVRAGAQPMDMGEWKRPHTYTSPEIEWKAVRERVGMIDVSTLGKLEVKGRDAGRLLDKVYTHTFSSLKVGRARYGVICGDDGIILDDGTVSRLAEDHYYLTTTTGNTEFVERWLEWWLAGTGFCAHVTNLTGDFAAVNLAGQKARDVLKKLTPLDVSAEACKYMSCLQGDVAGVTARLLRIGFVGETGWEIHYPACYGEYLWTTLLEAGRDFDIMPFGVEAQRILRLEKKHIIVGQDTDALSNPLEADMEWVARFEKEDFIGKPGLLAARAQGTRNKLIGFVSEQLVPEGSAVVLDQKPVGRVTSARMSPALNRCVGMAWVPHALSSEGTTLQIQSNGNLYTASVHLSPFYDPEGKRLKE